MPGDAVLGIRILWALFTLLPPADGGVEGIVCWGSPLPESTISPAGSGGGGGMYRLGNLGGGLGFVLLIPPLIPGGLGATEGLP